MWYSKISKDISYIPDAVDHYNDQLLEAKTELLYTALKRSDSALAVTVTKLEILTQISK